MLWGREPEHTCGQREESEYDAPEVPPVGEVAERQNKEGSYIPTEDIVVARPHLRSELVRRPCGDHDRRG